MAECFIVTCIECNGYSFTKAGEKFAVTRICRRCENGWSSPAVNSKARKPKKMAPGKADGSIGREKKPKANQNPYGVAPGQVWESLDPRDNGRKVEVLGIDETHAEVLSDGTRRRRIKLTGFTKVKGRGYRRTDKGGPKVA